MNQYGTSSINGLNFTTEFQSAELCICNIHTFRATGAFPQWLASFLTVAPHKNTVVVEVVTPSPLSGSLN